MGPGCCCCSSSATSSAPASTPLTGDIAGEVGGVAWAAVPGRVHRGHAHGVLLPRAGHQVPAGGRGRALHPQGVRHPLRDVPGRLHRDVLRHHLAPRRRPTCFRQLRSTTASSSASTDGTARHAGRRAGLHGGARADQPARRRRERKFNVVLTLVELSGLLHRHLHRLLRDGRGKAPTSPGRRVRVRRATRAPSSRVTAATALAFFAMVGFEDSVNMAEEMQGPGADLPARSCSPAWASPA